VDRLTAKHKAVFDSAEIMDGLALFHARQYMKGYRDVYDIGDGDVQAVVVMRHEAAPMAFGDALWAKYKLGALLKLKDPTTGKPALRNPFYRVSKEDKDPYVSADGSLDALHSRGAVLLACNQAAMGFAHYIAARTKSDPEALKAEVRAGLVPGAILMPTGIFAVLRAQEAGCVYFKSA
jgi:hypothetical protein